MCVCVCVSIFVCVCVCVCLLSVVDSAFEVCVFFWVKWLRLHRRVCEVVICRVFCDEVCWS